MSQLLTLYTTRSLSGTRRLRLRVMGKDHDTLALQTEATWKELYDREPTYNPRYQNAYRTRIATSLLLLLAAATLSCVLTGCVVGRNIMRPHTAPPSYKESPRISHRSHCASSGRSFVDPPLEAGLWTVASAGRDAARQVVGDLQRP